MNKNIFCLITVVVIILLIDLVFNISKPLFRVSEGFSDDDDDTKHILSIESHIDGTILNIDKISEDAGADDEYYIPLYDGNDSVLGLDDTTKDLIVKNKDQNNIKWKLIDSTEDIINKKDDDTDNFHLLIMKMGDDINYALQYRYGRVIAVKLSKTDNPNIYDRHKWNTRYSRGPKNELVIKDIKASVIGPVGYSRSTQDNDDINIKFNLEDGKLRDLLNLNNNTESTESEKCDTWLSRDSVKSLCPGCV